MLWCYYFLIWQLANSVKKTVTFGIKSKQMKKILPLKNKFSLFLSILLINISATAQTVQITANPSNSVNIIIGNNNYHVLESIYTETEVGAANFTTAATAINHIDFNVFALGSLTTANNYKIYLKEVPPGTTTFTTGVYNTAGYTLVFNGSYTASALGWAGVDLTTPFVRTAGNNLQILIERFDGVNHGAYNFFCAKGNNTDANALTCRRINSAGLPVSGTTSLTASAFRPQIQLRHINTNDAAITQVYTMGKLPIPFAVPQVVSANIINNGSGTINNLNVTLNVSGANSFNNMQTIASLAPGASAVVTFAPFTPTVVGNNTVNVSMPADDFPADNTRSVAQEITNNSYNYAYGNISTNSVGYNGGTIDFAVKVVTVVPTSINQVGVYFVTGGQPFKIGVWDKSGTGLPGALLWESLQQTSTTGLFTLPISPAIPLTDTLFIGVRQTGQTNVQFAAQSENPVRTNTFFVTDPNSTVWHDFSPANPYRLMIEPRLTVADDVGIGTIKNPISSTTIDNCGLIPQASVSNFGSNNQTTPFNATFSIRQAGNTVYTDTKPLSLNSGVTQTVYFAPFTGSVTGSDSAIVYTSLATDAARNNDTIVNVFTTNNYSYSIATATSGGYSFANSTVCAIPSPIRPTYSWITETSNEVNWGSDGDDVVSATPITIPFPFKYFGNIYNQFWICSNGWISFTNSTGIGASIQSTPVTIPLASGIQNYIAGALTDLDNTPSFYPDAHTYYGGDATQFVVTFYHAHRLGSASDYITFQIILKVNGDILIQYNDAESSNPVTTGITNFCTIGIENALGTNGILYRFNGNRGPMFGSPLALLFIAPQTPLPVSLMNFTAQRIKNINKISWSTSQENNAANFVVERSKDGRNFSSIGQVAATGNSSTTVNYFFTDNAPFKSINYYRLRMTDAGNAIKYSPVKSVRNNGTADISFFPLPVKDKLNIVVNAEAADKVTITVTDINGKTVIVKTMMVAAGNNTLSLATDQLSEGMYVIKINLADDVLVKKISKL